MNTTVLSRRSFLRRTALTATAASLLPIIRTRGKGSPNEKLNLGVVGVSGRGADNLREVASQNIVALCDTDEIHLRAAAQKFPAAKTYVDFRRLVDQPEIDAMVV